GYCLLEALRNYMQHRALPICGLYFTQDRPDDASGHRRCTCAAQINLAQLMEDKKFRDLAETRLASQPNLLDIRPFVRDYIAGLGSVHKKLREWMSDDVKHWRGTIEAAQAQFRREHGEDDIGLAIVERDENGRNTHSADIF